MRCNSKRREGASHKGPFLVTHLNQITWMMVGGVVSEIPLIQEPFTTSETHEVPS